MLSHLGRRLILLSLHAHTPHTQFEGKLLNASPHPPSALSTT